MTEDERKDFRAYLRTLTDAQVQGVIDKEAELQRRAPESKHHEACGLMAMEELELRAARKGT
jgi:hypothetical protein